MDIDAISTRVDELLAIRLGEHFRENDNTLLQGAISLLSAVYGSSSTQLAPLKAQHTSPYSGARTARAALLNLKRELELGLLGNLRMTLAGETIADLITLAKQCKDDSKEVAAVLAAAAFEDTIRRLGSERAGVSGRPDLADVLTILKDQGITQGPQVGIAQSYLKFRNDALHADWDKIENESIAAVLGFVEILILKHFS